MDKKYDDDDDTVVLDPLPEEPLTVTFTIAELVPGTYVYLDSEDVVVATGALEDEPLPELFARDPDERNDTIPDIKTIVGPLLSPRRPAEVLAAVPVHVDDVRGSPIKPRLPAPGKK